MPYRELPEAVGELEEEILRTWEEEDTFRRSLNRRDGGHEFVFYEGPPTANGRPGVHHILARTIKDLVARFWTMRGRHVTRIAGWDTHGLPVEIEAEKQLGISGKPEIERLGVDAFNRVCRENIFTYQEEWERLSRRIAYWLDYDDPYVTCAPEYVESAWWAIREIDRKGLLYRGHKVVPYCPRCGTGLSSHEVAQGYAERKDPSVFVRFPVVEERGAADGADGANVGEGASGAPGPDGENRRSLLVWTTTPWTLVSNVAVAYNPHLEYVEVEAERPAAAEALDDDEGATVGRQSGEADDGRLILARRAADRIFDLEGDAPRGRVVREVPPAELAELRYRRPLHLYAEYPEAEARLYPADFVTGEEGTGLVHIAPAFGADDFRLGQEHDLPVVRPVDDDGCFLAEVEEVGGRPVKEADERLTAILREKGLLFREATVRHTYPHCWRCETPLLYMARDSWYVATTKVKERLLAENASVDWHPPEVGSGRMGEWLENNVDWALSRDRYWGTPLPIWVCDREEEHREVLGSFDELAERAGPLSDDFDPHRPEIDGFAWPCRRNGCGGEMRRTPEVADAWFDSGAMPFAQWHYPFENEDAFREHFPADVIAEGVDQTRGWFYSLLAESVILFERSAYRSVVVNDLILDADGQKMSKSRGNVVDPWEAIERHGADAIRFYLLSVSNPWIPKRWDPEGLEEVERKLLDTLRNSFRFFAMYANLEAWSGACDTPPPERPVMDRWLLSRLDTVAAAVRDDLEAYDLTRAARRLSDFVIDEISNWYVRRTRERFWATGSAGVDGELHTAAAFATLREALRITALLLAPFTPFVADWIHRELDDGRSAHLADFPAPRGHRDERLEREMRDARELATLGRAARESAGVKVRQPLSTLRAVIPGGRRLSGPVLRVLAEELNVKRVVFPDATDEIVRLSVKPEYGQLGPRFGPRTPRVAAALKSLDEDRARRLRGGESVPVRVGDEEVEVLPDEVSVLEEGRGDVAMASGDGYLAALDLTVDDELRAEGLARELVSRVQRLRRSAGFDVADRIHLAVAGPDEIVDAVRRHEAYIAGETLAAGVRVGEEAAEELPHAAELEIEGHAVRIAVGRRAARAGAVHGPEFHDVS